MGENVDRGDEVDRADLQRDLDRIKEAMGLAERYENAPEQWLGFGVVVAVACALSQYVVLERLPQAWFAAVWLGLFGALGAVLSRRYGYSFEPGTARPNLGFQILAVYFAAFPIAAVAGSFLPELSYLEETAFTLAIILVQLGAGYVVAGETLKAYHIRDRDRYAFHAGGLLMVGLGVTVATYEPLYEWGYAAFGGAYLAYAVASYWVLSSS
ncbi:hypothetical protein [Halovivax limisalsi]|uniref:hypothetical protein n=1 Tax=Halovivax limisalsi TaxID=1453760 RepID=UPI001FFC45B9|nr:hypothetical protein [Halovivax limisalsi]